MLIKAKRLLPRAKLPTKAYGDGDAGWDIYASCNTLIESGDQVRVPVDLAIELPKGYFVEVHTKSSYGARGLKAHLGIIDNGYRGDLGVLMFNYGKEQQRIEAGDKVAQLIVRKQEDIGWTVEERLELSDSERGEKGFGSSGR
jgi:dUTP pyrophosphatase